MRLVLINSFILLCCLLGSQAQGQSIVWEDEKSANTPVFERLPEELKPQPLTYNGFEYQASAALETRYDDNILAQPDKSSDYIVSLNPKLLLSKTYSTHRFKAGFEGHIERFANRSEENKENLSLFSRALLFANNKWEFPLFVGFQKRARERDEPQAMISDVPLDIQTLRANAGVTRNFNRLSVGLLGEYQSVKSENGKQLGGNGSAIFSDNDREVYRAKLRTRYDISQGAPGAENVPSHILFADFIYGHHDYKRGRFVNGRFSGPSGDRNEYGVLAGIESNYKGILFARVGGGYTQQSFDNQGLDDIDLIDVEANIAYNLTPKLTLSLDVMRDINQDNGFTNALTETSYALDADYELLHNLYLNSRFGYADYEFEGLARDDEELSAELGLRYYNSRRIETGLGFKWQDRDSTSAANDFDRLVFMMSLTGKL